MTKPTQSYFYKYVTADVAKLILVNRTVRYSAPIRFNDPFDTQIDLHFPFDLEDLCEPTMERYLAAANSSTPLPNADVDPRVLVMEKFRQVRDRIGMSDRDLRVEFMPAIKAGIENLKKSLPEMHLELRNRFMNNVKVFCVSAICDNLLMWSHYADAHKGAVIKFLCLPHMDNPLCVAKPIVYSDNMPVLATLEEWIDSAFGFKSIDYTTLWDRLCLIKSIDWAYEQEWRVIIPDEAIGADFTDLKIYPQEVAEIIIGCRMPNRDVEDILALLSCDFAHVTATQALKSPRQFRLEFEHLKKSARSSA
jgi:hypothetical protein